MAITVTGPDWPTTHALRAALAQAPETGAVRWGASPCNKLEAFSRLRTGGLYTPIATTSLEEALDWHRWGMEVWGRKLRHTQGKDIARYNPMLTKEANLGGPRWRGRDFWVQVLPSLREWRCHVWGERVFRTGVKLPPETPTPAIHPIRSDRQGWNLCYSDTLLNNFMPERKPLRGVARQAIAALGIAGGAVDILESPRGELFVLEVNTAPALGENTLDAYVNAIRASLRGVA